MTDPDDDDSPSRPPYAALAALVLIGALIAGGLWLTRRLDAIGRIQDCVASGRTNCVPAAPSQRP